MLVHSNTYLALSVILLVGMILGLRTAVRELSSPTLLGVGVLACLFGALLAKTSSILLFLAGSALALGGFLASCIGLFGSIFRRTRASHRGETSRSPADQQASDNER